MSSKNELHLAKKEDIGKLLKFTILKERFILACDCQVS